MKRRLALCWVLDWRKKEFVADGLLQSRSKFESLRTGLSARTFCPDGMSVFTLSNQ